jgi:hypothetical protein
MTIHALARLCVAYPSSVCSGLNLYSPLKIEGGKVGPVTLYLWFRGKMNCRVHGKCSDDSPDYN